MVDAGLLAKYNYDSRLAKATKIERMLDDWMGPSSNWRDLACLDVGCSIGVIASHLAGRFGRVVGLDPLPEAIELARKLHPDSRASFLCGGGRVGRRDGGHRFHAA